MDESIFLKEKLPEIVQEVMAMNKTNKQIMVKSGPNLKFLIYSYDSGLELSKYIYIIRFIGKKLCRPATFCGACPSGGSDVLDGLT